MYTPRIRRPQDLRHVRRQRHLSMLHCTVPGLQRLDQSWVVEQKKEHNYLKLSIATPLALPHLCKRYKGLQRKAMCRAWMGVDYRYDLRTQHLTLYSKGAVLLLPSSGALKHTGSLGKRRSLYNRLRLSTMKYKLKQRRSM